MYLPVFNALGIEVSGFTSRSKEKGKAFSQETGLTYFDNIDQLATSTTPDYFLIAVAMGDNAKVAHQLLKYNKPIIIETPLAWSKSESLALISKANELGVKLYVMEQFPYFPKELLKQQLYNDNIFGKVYAVFNDFCAYKYHGIARARQYIEGKAVGLRSQTVNFDLPAPAMDQNPSWQMADIEFSNGSRLFHVYSPGYWGCDICPPVSFKIYGEKATMVDDTIKLILDGQSEAVTADIVEEKNDDGTTRQLSLSIPNGKEYVWQNPYQQHNLSDEQTAIAVLLNAVLNNGHQGILPYTANDFVNDIEIDQAMNISDARSGANVDLPLNEKKQKILKLLSYKFWKSKLIR